MHRFRPAAFGWLRDLPDPRDYGPDHPNVAEIARELRPRGTPRASKTDWSEFFPEVEDQLNPSACTSCACAGLTGYFERRSNGLSVRSSWHFLYQVTHWLSGRPEGAGVELRTTLKALARFGIPPERYWPYDPARAPEEPGPFLFAYGREYQSLVYIRLDPIGSAGPQVLQRVRAHLSGGFPSVFGFSAFESLTNGADIPFPTRFDAVIGGSTAVAVGFDDTRRIRSTRGALRVRMSWGAAWGDEGYGWLPYAFVEEGLANDFWTLLRPDWIGSGEFFAPEG
jgi:C1A family cysteine protease